MSDASIPQDPNGTGVPSHEALSPEVRRTSMTGAEDEFQPSRGRAFAWSRFLARQIDLALFGLLFWGVAIVAFPAIPVPTNVMVSTFVTFPVALLIEVPVMTLFGWTLGKLIFRISVRRADGSKLSFAEVFRRNLVLWVRGLGLGLPGLNAIFQGWCYRDAWAGKPSRWDAKAMHIVHQPRIGGWRWALGLTVFAGIFAFMMMPSVLSLLNRPIRHTPPAPTSPSFVWSNPETGQAVTIPAGWSAAPDRKDAPASHEFDHGDSFVLLMEDTISKATLDEFISAMRATANYGTLRSQHVETGADGRRVFILNYRDVDQGQTFHVSVRAWETEPGTFWRAITSTPAGDQAETDAATAVAKILAKTTQGSKSPLSP